MAVFRGTDRIRSIKAAIRQSFRHVRSMHLKGMTVVKKLTLSNASHSRRYRRPLVAGAIILILMIAAVGGHQYVQAQKVEYFKVLVDGKPVGEISSKQKVEQLLAQINTQLEQADRPVRTALNEGQVTYTALKGYKKKTDDEATLALLPKVLKTHPVGVKLIVDGREIGIVRDQKTADALLERVKNKYVPATATATAEPTMKNMSFTANSAQTMAAKPERKIKSADFEESVKTETVDLNSPQISDPDELYRKLTMRQKTPRNYTVKKGDCIGCIAAKLNISEELIYQNNTWIKNDKINVGDVLDLSVPEPPMLNVKSEEIVTEIEVIDPKVQYKTSDDLKRGKSKVLQKGTEGRQQVTYRLLKRNGALIEEEKVDQKVLKPSTPTIILRGTKVMRGEGTGTFSWPVVGARITSYMGSRWGRMHKGIDIVGKKSILAADNGVIEFAGYKSGGLGNAVIIDHNNGFKTVYGHMKSVKVKKGQIVEKGETIGIMGSTGRSTGTHLHFEVHYQDKVKNPTRYL